MDKKRKYVTPSISVIPEGSERYIRIMIEIELQRANENPKTSRTNNNEE